MKKFHIDNFFFYFISYLNTHYIIGWDQFGYFRVILDLHV